MSALQSYAGDVRYALRQLRRAPGFVATAVLTVALGIGATTAIFSLVYQVILRSLPVSHPEQLYRVGKNIDCCATGGIQEPWDLFSYDLYKTLRDRTPHVRAMAAVSAAQFPVSARRPGEAAEAQPLAVEFVSGNYFSLLGVEAYAGRVLNAGDDREGAAPAAVLGYRLWQTKFAGDSHLVGSTLLLAGHPVTVVGIAAPHFLSERNVNDPAGIWLPLAQEPSFHPDEAFLRLPGIHWLDLLTRIPNQRDVPQVQAALRTELRQWVLAHPETTQNATPDQMRRVSTDLSSAHDGLNRLRGQYERNLQMLLLIAGFVLLIACANLANLMLVRGVARGPEFALRGALGAPRSRLVRQAMVEALLLALAGGLAALPVAFLGARAMLVFAFKGVEYVPLTATPSLPVLVFALVVSLLTGLVFGIIPAWISSRLTPVDALRGTHRSTGEANALPQRMLIVSQAALSLALLSTAGLLITSLRQLEHQDFRFESHGRLIVTTDLTAAGYTADRLPALYQRMDDTFARLPSVESFAYATYGPMTGASWSTAVWFPGGGDKGQPVGYLAASARYFETIGTRVKLGRSFSSQDTATSRHVAVVNRAFADKYLAGHQPIGMHFGPAPSSRNEFEIVGVVQNSKYGDASAAVEPMLFKPITQVTSFARRQDRTVESAVHSASNLIVMYRGDSRAAEKQVRTALGSINPDIPILQLTTYDDQIADNFTQEELVVRLTTLFGLLALVLASLGLYGVTAYSVERRTGEIGVRMALGASRGNVLGLVLRGALAQTAVGLAVGVPFSLLAARLLRHSLYQTAAFQPGLLLGVLLLLLLAAITASWLPARRAARVEPMQALRAV